MKEKLKKQKGITLVALVITIIVLLILAMVSINIVMNQGIMTKSKDAADKYNQKAEEEQGELTFFERLFGKYNGEETTEGPYVTPRTEVTYKGQTLKVGDYVNYDEGTGYTWTTDSTKGTGKDYDWSTKTLTSGTYTTEDMGWRVLGLDAEGNLELISDKQTSERLYLYGKAGYNNGVDQLKEMCDALYGKGEKAKSARSLTDDDLNAILGYNKRAFEYEGLGCYDRNYHIKYGYKVTYYADKTVWDPKDTFGMDEFLREEYHKKITDINSLEATNENPITIESNFYGYEKSEFSSRINLELLESIFGTYEGSNYGDSPGLSYWLASSQVVDPELEYVYWGIRSIGYGQLGMNDLYDSSNGERCDDAFIRPVVTLKSDIQLSGNSESGWTIQ